MINEIKEIIIINLFFNISASANDTKIWYWFGTGMLDWNLEQNFSSCVTGNMIREEMWVPKHIKNMGPCVTFQIAKERDALTTSDCNRQVNIMCQKVGYKKSFKLFIKVIKSKINHVFLYFNKSIKY
jgi:hypothetical protein